MKPYLKEAMSVKESDNIYCPPGCPHLLCQDFMIYSCLDTRKGLIQFRLEVRDDSIVKRKGCHLAQPDQVNQDEDSAEQGT